MHILLEFKPEDIYKIFGEFFDSRIRNYSFWDVLEKMDKRSKEDFEDIYYPAKAVELKGSYVIKFFSLLKKNMEDMPEINYYSFWDIVKKHGLYIEIFSYIAEKNLKIDPYVKGLIEEAFKAKDLKTYDNIMDSIMTGRAFRASIDDAIIQHNMKSLIRPFYEDNLWQVYEITSHREARLIGGGACRWCVSSSSGESYMKQYKERNLALFAFVNKKDRDEKYLLAVPENLNVINKWMGIIVKKDLSEIHKQLKEIIATHIDNILENNLNLNMMWNRRQAIIERLEEIEKNEIRIIHDIFSPEFKEKVNNKFPNLLIGNVGPYYGLYMTISVIIYDYLKDRLPSVNFSSYYKRILDELFSVTIHYMEEVFGIDKIYKITDNSFENFLHDVYNLNDAFYLRIPLTEQLNSLIKEQLNSEQGIKEVVSAFIKKDESINQFSGYEFADIQNNHIHMPNKIFNLIKVALPNYVEYVKFMVNTFKKNENIGQSSGVIYRIITEILMKQTPKLIPNYLKEIEKDILNLSTEREELKPLISKLQEMSSDVKIQQLSDMGEQIQKMISRVKEQFEPYREKYSLLNWNNRSKFLDYLFRDNLKNIKTFIMNNEEIKKYIANIKDRSYLKDVVFTNFDNFHVIMKEHLNDTVSAIGFIFLTLIIKFINEEVGEELEITLDKLLDKY